MSVFIDIKEMKPETPLTEPVVACLKCHKDFVWWLHPVQLCDGCVALEFSQAEIDNLGP